VDLDWDNLWTDSLDGTPRFVKWLNVKYADISELKASATIEGNGFQVKPEYEDADNGNFTPIEGSNLVDVGVVIEGINDRFIAGAGPDLGAFERGGVNPLPDGGVPDGGSSSSSSGGGLGGAGGASSSGGPNGESPEEKGGCGCRVGSGAAEGIAVNAMAALALGFLLRRKKRARG
jgi:MYXO-CTERM domain-containing protein